MAARSVAELLPRPFDELEVADVESILAAVGEQRETLFFERKASLQVGALAKTCAAFANTLGGLLVVGAEDASDELPGIERPGGEVQVWVKDVLRPRILPLPALRARWLRIDGERGLLLVIVEESSTTPHLLTEQGAIYIRHPGSSDPVPIADQARLLDLLHRGERARGRAEGRAAHILGENVFQAQGGRQALALVPTGISEEFEHRLFDQPNLELLRAANEAIWDPQKNDFFADDWSQDVVSVVRRRFPEWRGVWPQRLLGVAVWRDGPCLLEIADADVVEHPDVISEEQLVDAFSRLLAAGRELLAHLGGHGDLRIAFSVALSPRYLQLQSKVAEAFGIRIALWGSLAAVPQDDE